jgi:hypothetical protein
MLRWPLFVDTRYHAEQVIELDLQAVVATEEKRTRLFMGGWHDVTIVTLENGERITLRGKLAQKIAAAKTEL